MPRENEAAERIAVVNEGLTWLGTPYVTNGDIKDAGVDCAMILIRIFADVGLIENFDPRPYPAQWAIHQRTERYLAEILRFADEIPGPPKPGDVVLFKFGHCWAHGALVVDWPTILHANPPGKCRIESCEQNIKLNARMKRFFSFWAKKE